MKVESTVKKAIITGATGFIGTALCKELLMEMSLGEIVTQEEFESNDILKTYDLLEERSKETWVDERKSRILYWEGYGWGVS